MDWDELARREEEFMSSGERNLRHHVSSVGVSDLAGQFFCEFKIENEFRFGEVPSEAKEEGTAFHDELIPQKEITRNAFVQLVRQKTPSYAVLRVWGKLSEIRVLGMPDHIIWSDEKPRWLVELKTTSREPTTLWPDQRAQAVIYGALLDKMGFDCSDLQLAVIRIRAKELSEEERLGWITAVSRHLLAGTVEVLEAQHRGMMKAFLLKHDVAEAEATVRLMQDYWLLKREPYSSDNPNKCAACEYNDVCPKSLVVRP